MQIEAEHGFPEWSAPMQIIVLPEPGPGPGTCIFVHNALSLCIHMEATGILLFN